MPAFTERVLSVGESRHRAWLNPSQAYGPETKFLKRYVISTFGRAKKRKSRVPKVFLRIAREIDFFRTKTTVDID
jgi:hypothetical protein